MDIYLNKTTGQLTTRIDQKNPNQIYIGSSEDISEIAQYFRLSGQDLEDDGVCTFCGNDLEPIYENNGFSEPSGPSHWEISGYKSCECRKEQNEI